MKESQQRRDADIYEKFDYADIWLRDGLRVVDPPGFFAAREVDVSRCRRLLEKLRGIGIRMTYTHIFVRATAMVLSRNPQLHQLITERHRLIPGNVDIGLSVAAGTVVAPVLVIEDAGRKTLTEIAAEVTARTPEARKGLLQMQTLARRWGWLVPTGWLRRSILRLLTKQLWFRRKGVGTFQVTCLRDVDQFVPFLFSTSAILGVGRVRDRVIAIDGRPEVRPTVMLSCCADHKVWDGALAEKFLRELASILESGELASEFNFELG